MSFKIIGSTGFIKTVPKRNKKINGKIFTEYFTGSNKHDIKYNLDKIKILGWHYRVETNKWGNTTIWIRKGS